MRKILKTIMVVLNLVLALLLVVSTLAGRVAPSRMVWVSLLGYGYLYFLIANVVCILLWLLVGSKWFLLSLVAVVARYSFLPLYFQMGGVEQVSQEERAAEGMIKVLTYNVHHFQGIDLDSRLTENNMTRFLELVDEEQPDLLAMQEYIGKGGKVHLTEALRQRGYEYMTSGYDNGSMTGEVVFSKLPLLRVVRIEGPSKLYVQALWGDDTLRFYCLHLVSYGLDASDHQQLHDLSKGDLPPSQLMADGGTLTKFRRAIKAHEEEWNVLEPYWKAHERLTVVAGDLNDPPASYFYQRCRSFFKDSYCEAGQGFSTTYHGHFTRRSRGVFPAFRIDMVLHTSDLQAVSYRRVKSDISDHDPVIVTLKKTS
ncbi:MAG: hypothetical protein IJM88_03480 [Bacteroidales bacterium]|nr:hypothetical protein [Bacteroidales bacterium]